jgi:hypothetical protein
MEIQHVRVGINHEYQVPNPQLLFSITAVPSLQLSHQSENSNIADHRAGFRCAVITIVNTATNQPGYHQ